MYTFRNLEAAKFHLIYSELLLVIGEISLTLKEHAEQASVTNIAFQMPNSCITTYASQESGRRTEIPVTTERFERFAAHDGGVRSDRNLGKHQLTALLLRLFYSHLVSPIVKSLYAH